MLVHPDLNMEKDAFFFGENRKFYILICSINFFIYLCTPIFPAFLFIDRESDITAGRI